MSGVVTFFWLSSDGDANYARVPRDETRAVALRFMASSAEIEIMLSGSYTGMEIPIDPRDADMDEDQARKLGNKMIDSIRSLSDEDVSWEHDGDRWKMAQSKSSDVWGLSR